MEGLELELALKELVGTEGASAVVTRDGMMVEFFNLKIWGIK